MSQGYTTLSHPEASWAEHAFQPQKDRAVMCCAIFNSALWIIFFGLFVWSQDDNCSQGELYYFSKVAFFMFIACFVIELITMALLFVKTRNSENKRAITIFSCILVLIDVGFGLFIYIRGIVVLYQDQPISGCESIFYLVLVYVLFISILLSLFVLAAIVAFSCYVCNQSK